MNNISSGSSAGRVIRAILLAVLVDGFAGAYLWDGYVGYARDNARALTGSLGLSP